MPIYTCDFSENGTALIRREGDDGLVHRISKTPGLDISELPDNIQEQIDAHWTPEVVAAYAEERKTQAGNDFTKEFWRPVEA